MLIGVTGASGFIGRSLVEAALRRGHEVIAFSRRPHETLSGCTMRPFSTEEPPDISGCEGIVNLAGEPILGLWTATKKRRIAQSRHVGTRRLVEAIQSAANPPEVLISGSAVGLYADGGDRELAEDGARGNVFLAEVVSDWEAEALKANASRVVLLRTGIVLGRNGGALRSLKPVFQAGLGGNLGQGQQWMPWIHLADIVGLILFALENLDVQGPMNATAPWPVRNDEFTKTLAKILHRPAFLHLPRILLRITGDISEEFLSSRRVVPVVATEQGFRFQFPELEGALRDLLL